MVPAHFHCINDEKLLTTIRITLKLLFCVFSPGNAYLSKTYLDIVVELVEALCESDKF